MEVDSVRSFKLKLTEAAKSGRVDAPKWIRDNFWLEDLFAGSHDAGARVEAEKIRKTVGKLLDEVNATYGQLDPAGQASWSRQLPRNFSRRIDAVIDDVEELTHKSHARAAGPGSVKALLHRIFTTPATRIVQTGFTRFVDRFWWPDRGIDVAEAVIRGRYFLSRQLRSILDKLEEIASRLGSAHGIEESTRTRIVQRITSLMDDLHTMDPDVYVPDHAPHILDDLARHIIPAIDEIDKDLEDLGSYSSDPQLRFFQEKMQFVKGRVKLMRTKYADLVVDSNKLIEMAKSLEPSHATFASSI